MLAMLDVCKFPEQLGLKFGFLHLILPLLAGQHGVSSLLQNGSQHVWELVEGSCGFFGPAAVHEGRLG